jgi:hypothetical protein
MARHKPTVPCWRRKSESSRTAERKRRGRRAAAAVAVAVLVAAPPRAASAQQKTVSDVLTFLMTNRNEVATGNPEFDLAAAQATSDTISRALLANIATLPVTSSSGAFVYQLNPELGTVERATQSFGPFFIERALTAGRGETSFALTFQHVHFSSLDGRSLRDGTFVTTANRFTDQATPYDENRVTLNIDASVATFYGNVGVAKGLEFGFAVPMVALQLNGSRVEAYYGRAFTQATASATAVGLADIVLRTKYTAYADHGSGVAGAVDVRLPTGKQENLLGAGSTSLKFTGIASFESGRTTMHANGGYSVGGLARELSYGGAVAVAASNRVTVSGELLGRSIDGIGRIVPSTAETPGLIGVDTIRLVPDASALHILTAVPGIKWNVTDTWILVGNVSVPLTNAGLTSRFTPFVGLDYAFGR